jgi:hypothetical protein
MPPAASVWMMASMSAGSSALLGHICFRFGTECVYDNQISVARGLHFTRERGSRPPRWVIYYVEIILQSRQALPA